MSQLYVLVLDGDGPRKLHTPGCGWVDAITPKAALTIVERVLTWPGPVSCRGSEALSECDALAALQNLQERS